MDGLHEDAQALGEATVHWLRRTGISKDISKLDALLRMNLMTLTIALEAIIDLYTVA